MGVNLQLHGFDELKAKLLAMPAALKKKTLRNALAAGIRPVRDAAKRAAPVLTAENAKRNLNRKPGTVRDAIKMRTSKHASRAGNVGVFVNVAPAKGAKFKTTTRRMLGQKIRNRRQVRATQRGTLNDPFYWRWLEFGWNPGGGDRSRAGKRARRQLNRQTSTKQVAGRRFLRNAGARLPEAIPVVRAALARWIDKTNRSGKVTP